MTLFHSGCLESIDNNVKNMRTNTWYESIQDAINASIEKDTLMVEPGIYEEIVLISKEIRLIGSGSDKTIIQGNYTDDGITITADNVYVEGFTVKGGGSNTNTNVNAGIDIRSNNNHITNCIITDNDHYGMYVYGSHHNIISNCTFYQNKDRGLYFYSSTDNSVRNNTMTDEEYGLYCLSVEDSIFEENTISNTGHKGVYLGSDSTNNIFKDNIVRNNVDGIHVKGSTENTFLENLFINNTKGLYFCCGGKDNLVYNNVFFNNEDHSYGYPNNTYSYQNKGNFWDDYNGTDADDDGIGDIPYNIPCATGYCNQDEYPLMNPQ